jgi:hypothetical protein
MEGWDDSAPTRVAGPDGKTALHFKGCENAALPQQLFPMFAGFEVEFDAKPDVTDGTYALVGAGATAFEVYMKGGVVQANYFDACRYARQQGAIVSCALLQEFIQSHPDVIIAFYPIELALQDAHGEDLLLQLRIEKVKPATAVHLEHGHTLDASGGSCLQDVLRIEEIGHPEQQLGFRFADQVQLAALLARGA